MNALRFTFLNLIHCQRCCSPRENRKWWKHLLSIVNSRCNEVNQQLAGFNFMSHFLSTKHAATTSILSKRWKPLWHSVLTLDFDDETFKDPVCFLRIMHSIISLRDTTLPVHSFRFKCSKNSSCNLTDQTNVNRIVNFVLQRKIENFNLH
jgi:hypothetical protein